MFYDDTHIGHSTATELIAGSAPIEVTDKEALLRRLFGGVNNKTDEAKVLQQLMDETVAGVAVFAESGDLLFANNAYHRFELPSGPELRVAYRTSETGMVRYRQDLVSSTSIKVVELDGGYGVITDPVIDRLGVRDKAFGYLLDPTLADESILRRTALALGRASGWRWIGVSRFVDEKGGKVHFDGWWDAAELKPEYDLEVAGTGCEVTITSEEFCYFDGPQELRRRFPGWGAIENYPIKAYAGLVYRVNGKPVGHIVAMNDEPGMSRDLIEDLLRLFTQFMGAHIDLELQRNPTNLARENALIDDLTGLGNLDAFEHHLIAASESLASGDVEDVLVVVADLDNLVKVNERHGMEAGDRYIKSYAEVIRKMWRPTDHFFRIGPDKYAMVIAGINPDQVPLVQRRLMDGAADLTKAVRLEGVLTDISYGIAFASENGAAMAATVEAAEGMLGKMKAAHRARQLVREQLGR